MNFQERELLVSRIICGYLNYYVGRQKLKIVAPTVDIIYESNEIYQKTYNNALNSDILTEDDVYNLMIINGFWTKENEDKYNELPKSIDFLKEELYKNAFRDSIVSGIRKKLLEQKEQLTELTRTKNKFFHYTCSGIASYARLQFIIENCTYKNNKRYKWNQGSSYLALLHYQNNNISEEQLRLLSHTTPWANYWSCGKKVSLFSRPATELTYEQQRLMIWSSIYDNIRDHPDCPLDFIVDDDDMIDGWLIIKRKEKESKNSTTLPQSKAGQADEVYIVANNINEARKIDNLNDKRAQAIKKQRFKAIQKHGEIRDLELPDVKNRLLMEMAQAQKLK